MDNSRKTRRVTVDCRLHEERVPADHPLREIKGIVAVTLDELGAELQGLFDGSRWPRIAPERILRFQLLQALYSVRSEKLMLEQLEYNLLFRWFVGMSIDDRIWDSSSFARTRDALGGSDLARQFFTLVAERAEKAGLLSDEHFLVDPSLIGGLPRT